MDGGMDELLMDFCKLAASVLSTQSQSCILGSLCTGGMCEVKSAKSYVDEERHVTAKSCAKTETEGKEDERRVAWLVRPTQGIQLIGLIKTHSIFTRNNIIPDMQL